MLQPESYGLETRSQDRFLPVICEKKGLTVRTTLAALVAVCLVSVSALAWSSSRQVRPASSTATAPVSVEEALKALRHDLQAGRTDIIARNVSLTPEQAGKFWPVFDKYQKEQSAIMDAQLKGIQQYAEKYESLDDASALALMKAHLDRDQRMVTLRLKWFEEFQKVLPARLAARVMQIDRRISLAHQMDFAAQIPLVQ